MEVINHRSKSNSTKDESSSQPKIWTPRKTMAGLTEITLQDALNSTKNCS
jgi:hypothetical protein